MDGGWHRYDTSYTAWLDTPTSSADIQVRRAEMIESACNVMMSQQLLREYATEVADALRQRVLAAEERGFDVPGPCDAGLADACEYYDAVLLYRRMLEDAKALSVPREVITSSAALPLDQ
jgi:hypothetical protein